MPREYKILFDEREAIRIEVAAREKGISPEALIKDCCLFGLMDGFWKDLVDVLLVSHQSDIQEVSRGNFKEYSVIRITSGSLYGYVVQPIVEFPDRQKEQIPIWRIYRSDAMGNFQKLLWENEQGSLFPQKVYSGDVIRFAIPADSIVDPRTEKFQLTLRYYYKPTPHGELI